MSAIVDVLRMVESEADAFQQVRWFPLFQYDSQKFNSDTQRKHNLPLAELMKCYVLSLLCSVIMWGILSHPHWCKLCHFDVVIDNANIIGNLGRGKLACVFRYSQQMFLELFSTIFCSKVHRVFKTVGLWKGIKKNESIEKNQEKSKQTKLKKLNRKYMTLTTKMNEFFFTFSLVKNRIYWNIECNFGV